MIISFTRMKLNISLRVSNNTLLSSNSSLCNPLEMPSVKPGLCHLDFVVGLIYRLRVNFDQVSTIISPIYHPSENFPG